MQLRKQRCAEYYRASDVDAHHRCNASTMTAIVPMIATTCERIVKAPRTHFRPRDLPLLPEMQSRASLRFTHNTEAFFSCAYGASLLDSCAIIFHKPRLDNIPIG
jgi:hypothetical protein